METLKFKTNINCDSCIATVTPFMEKLGDVDWKVDTENKHKVLEVTGDNISEEAITEAVTEAGFNIEPLEPGFFKKLFKS